MIEPPPRTIRLTPPGRGAIATLLVEGPAAADLIDRQFRANSGRPLNSYPVDRLVVGRIGSEPGEQSELAGQSEPGEEIVVRRRSPQAVELHCHGGEAAIARVESALGRLGCPAVGWHDWVADQYDDPIVAAAHAALAEARTGRTAAILLDQYHGALRRALDEIEELLRADDVTAARRRIDTLRARAELGRHLTRPWKVVLAGEANVGKSSLMGALLGYPRAIVHHAPGTTRDAVTASAAIQSWPVELSDTAGLNAGEDAIEQAGAALAREKVAGADLALLVFDAARAWSESNQSLLAAWPKALVVHNKSDLPAAAGPRPPGLPTSARTGEGVEALADAVADRLVDDPPPPGAAVPFTAEQFDQLSRLADRVA